MANRFLHTVNDPSQHVKASLLVQDVPVRATQSPGRGVLPDYLVQQSLPGFLANRDPQVEFAWQLLSAAPGLTN